MMKGRLVVLAVAVLAGLAFATPSQAGIIQTTVKFDLMGGVSPTATDVEVFYGTDISSGFSGPVLVHDGGLTLIGSGVFTAPNEITYNFMAASGTDATGLVFNFTTNANPVGIGSGSTLTGVTGNPTNTGLNITVAAVPEPASLGLLGIGMTGFLAFRRLFKRTAVA
jgi:hypothetical protein